MKPNPIELHTTTNGNNTKPLINSKHFILPIITLAVLITIHLYIGNFSQLRFISPGQSALNSTDDDHKCNVFQGTWVFDDERETYYTNETKCVIDDRQNCMKYGRPDTDFMKWRWQPNECDLPEFDAVEFLEIVRGKRLGFIGDSVGRNQMQSLVCMLASEAYPIAVYPNDTRLGQWIFPTYNFTLVAIWSPLLVKTRDPSPDNFTRNSIMNLYLDEADDVWTSQLQNLDIVIFSSGQWFFRPFVYYEKGEIIGCRFCNQENITDVSIYYAYQMAYKTTFTALLNLHNYTGLAYLRTFSPQHFENGEYNNGGNCVRTRPFTSQEMRLDGYKLQMYLTQVKEFKAAQKEGENKGLKLRLLDTSDAMILRPDGHPNHYGHPASDNKSFPDCVHWCMPGPVDTWNEFLLEMLKMEGDGFIDKTPQRNITRLNLR